MLPYSLSARLFAWVLIGASLVPAFQHLCGLASWGKEHQTEATDLLATEKAPCHPTTTAQDSPGPNSPGSPLPEQNLSCCSFQVTALVASPPVPEVDPSRARLHLPALPAQFVAVTTEPGRPIAVSVADPPIKHPALYVFYAHLLI
jgi:hypothetical protein